MTTPTDTPPPADTGPDNPQGSATTTVSVRGLPAWVDSALKRRAVFYSTSFADQVRDALIDAALDWQEYEKARAAAEAAEPKP